MQINVIARQVRRLLGNMSSTRLDDQAIFDIHNIEARQIVEGEDYWFAIVSGKELIFPAGTKRIDYPADYRSWIKGHIYLENATSPREVTPIDIEEAYRLGATTTGTVKNIIDDGKGFQLHDIPDAEVVLRLSYNALPAEISGPEGTNFLTDNCPDVLTHFLAWKCANAMNGMTETAMIQRGEYENAKDLLAAENLVRRAGKLEMVGRSDAEDAGYGLDGGLVI